MPNCYNRHLDHKKNLSKREYISVFIKLVDDMRRIFKKIEEILPDGSCLHAQRDGSIKQIAIPQILTYKEARRERSLHKAEEHNRGQKDTCTPGTIPARER